MSVFDDPRVYQALALPDDALDKGGVEILRAGVINDELYVSARNVLQDMAQWGEVLADIARRIGELVAAEGEYSEREAIAAIASAFAADLGAPAVTSAPRKKAGKTRRARKGRPASVKAAKRSKPRKPAKSPSTKSHSTKSRATRVRKSRSKR